MANTIRSNSEFLKSNLSTINKGLSLVDDTNLSCHESYDSTTSCPSAEPPIVDTFLASCSELFQRIASEVELINQIGDGIAELDNNLKDAATKLDIQILPNIGSSAIAKVFDNKEFITDEEIDSKMKTAADNANIDLADLELQHDAYTYGKIYGNNQTPNNYDDEFNNQIEEPITRITDGTYREYTPSIPEEEFINNYPKDEEGYDIVNPKELSNELTEEQIAANKIAKATGLITQQGTTYGNNNKKEENNHGYNI